MKIINNKNKRIFNLNPKDGERLLKSSHNKDQRFSVYTEKEAKNLGLEQENTTKQDQDSSTNSRGRKRKEDNVDQEDVVPDFTESKSIDDNKIQISNLVEQLNNGKKI